MQHKVCGAFFNADGTPAPYIGNAARASRKNADFRMTFWSGEKLQMTLMNIPARGETGFEMSPDTDLYIRVEAGRALAIIGNGGAAAVSRRSIGRNDAVFIPAGTWHNVVNSARKTLKLSSVSQRPRVSERR